jgi:hypothetical protein
MWLREIVAVNFDLLCWKRKQNIKCWMGVEGEGMFEMYDMGEVRVLER